MSSNKELSMTRPGGNHMSRFDKKAEKLKNPKETTKRLVAYMGTRKGILLLIFIFSLITTLITT
jgi:ATP-binding cassette subfamily B protein